MQSIPESCNKNYFFILIIMLSDHIFLNIAQEIAKGSKCVSKHVGAIIVKNNRILSTGYNGTPSGYMNCLEYWKWEHTKEHHDWSSKYEIHAEMNALLWAARTWICVEGATLYTTLQPCFQCTKNILASWIEKIVYANDYEHNNTQEIEEFVHQNKKIIIQVK